MGNVSTIIGIPCATQGRWNGFWQAVLNLQTVPGTVVLPVRGPSVAGNRNEVVREGLRMGAEWFFFLDDDLLFSPNVLKQLMARDVDAVVGLSLKRKPPFLPLIYDRQNDDGSAYERLLHPGESGMVVIKAATSGGLLVKRKVFEKMTDPWWTLGQVGGVKGSDGWGDDLHFCLKLRQAGFTLWCDLEVPFGHVTEVVVWPMRRGNQWSTSIVSDVPFAELPAAGDPAWAGPVEQPTNGTPQQYSSRKGELRSWRK